MRHETALWSEWGSLTRFLEGARLAFARERALWQSLEIHNRDSVRLSFPIGGRVYKAPLAAHLQAMQDEQMLYASVLIHSYALTEFAACSHLGVDPRQCQGIEDWGGRLLRSNDSDWSTGPKGGLSGAVEVAVFRNAFAHGTRSIDAAAARRLGKVGAEAPDPGTPVFLDYNQLRIFGGRLRGLLMAGGLADPKQASAG